LATHTLFEGEGMTKLLSVEEAMELLQISKPTMYRLTSKKKIPFYKIGGIVRFNEAHLMEWLESKGIKPEGGEDVRKAM